MSCWMWWLDSRPRWWRAWAETRTPRQQWKCCRRSCARCPMAQVSPPAQLSTAALAKWAAASTHSRDPGQPVALGYCLPHWESTCVYWAWGSAGRAVFFFLAPGGFWPNAACLWKGPSKCSGTASPICSECRPCCRSCGWTWQGQPLQLRACSAFCPFQSYMEGRMLQWNPSNCQVTHP